MPPKRRKKKAPVKTPNVDDGLDTMFESLGLDGESVSDHAVESYGLRVDRVTETEVDYFPSLLDCWVFQKTFLTMRNVALLQWKNTSNRELTARDVFETLPQFEEKDFPLLANIIKYLSREGMINFGRYERRPPIEEPLTVDKGAVIVIGAGASGIAAATQLEAFGFSVTILEMKCRVGGRVFNKHTDGGFVETGCDTLRNFQNSFMSTLLSQVPVTEHFFKENENVYKDGKQDVTKLALLEGLYENLYGGVNHLSYEKDLQKEDTGFYKSRQQIYEDLFSMLERQTAINHYNSAKTKADLSTKCSDLAAQMKRLHKCGLVAKKQLEDADGSDKLVVRALHRDIRAIQNDFIKNNDEIHRVADELKSHVLSPKQFMLPEDFRIYNFFLTCEEFRTGTELERIQFSNHMKRGIPDKEAVKVGEGLQEVFEKVVENRNIAIHKNCRVQEIDTSGSESVRVRCQIDGELIDLEAPFVISTLPLGTMKKAIQNHEHAPKFIPPLPEKHAEAIRAIGNGLINKIILEFSSPIIESDNVTQFGYVQKDVRFRGIMANWSILPHSRFVTTSYIALPYFHDSEDKYLTSRAMKTLREVIPELPPLVASYCTRWQVDQSAFGTGSYMGLETEPHHVEDIAKAIPCADGVNRLYFAGEHTSRDAMGTLEGAWYSGIRVAAELTNEHIGREFVPMELPTPVYCTKRPPAAYRYQPSSSSGPGTSSAGEFPFFNGCDPSTSSSPSTSNIGSMPSTSSKDYRQAVISAVSMYRDELMPSTSTVYQTKSSKSNGPSTSSVPSSSSKSKARCEPSTSSSSKSTSSKANRPSISSKSKTKFDPSSSAASTFATETKPSTSSTSCNPSTSLEATSETVNEPTTSSAPSTEP